MNISIGGIRENCEVRGRGPGFENVVLGARGLGIELFNKRLNTEMPGSWVRILNYIIWPLEAVCMLAQHRLHN